MFVGTSLGPFSALSLGTPPLENISFPTGGVDESHMTFVAQALLPGSTKFQGGVRGVNPPSFSLRPQGRSLAGQVALHMPLEFNSQATANYQDKEFGTMLGSLVNAGQDIDQGMLDALGGAFGGAITALKEGASDAVSNFGGVDVTSARQLLTNRIKNPHMEVLFSGTNFRQFTFNFKFSPKSQSDAQAMNTAIKFFRMYMQPEVDASDQLYLKAPAEFDIAIRGDIGGYSGIYHSFNRCVLVDCSVNAHGAGVAAQHSDGAPAEVDLSLTFKETSITTRSGVAAGL
jgi:hypothetical protein